MKWKDIFEDPDMVGQTEYLAIHDAIAVSALGSEAPDPDRKLTKKECRDVQAMLEEFQNQIHGLLGELCGSINIPTDSVDWHLLRKQKAELVKVIMSRKTGKRLRNVLEGIVGFLDDVQDRAETVLGKEAVFGTK